MKLAQIFESTERGNVGGMNAPGSMSMEDAQHALEQYADNQETFFFDDVENSDNIDIMVLAKVDNVDHQAPHNGSAWSVDSDVDYHGYTDVEWSIVKYAVSHDEDGEHWQVMDGEPKLSEAGQKNLDEMIGEKVQDGIDNPGHPDY